ncbi:MAG: hypothetical protein WCJ06_18860 [Planctomycetota bacterium]
MCNKQKKIAPAEGIRGHPDGTDRGKRHFQRPNILTYDKPNMN